MKSLFALAVFALPLSGYAADPKILGLTCTEEVHRQETKIVLEISVKGDRARIKFRNARELRPMAKMELAASDVAPILENKLEKMDKKSFEDKDNKVSISFKVDGRDFRGAPRLGIKLALPDSEEDDSEDNGVHKLSDCSADEESNMDPLR